MTKSVKCCLTYGIRDEERGELSQSLGLEYVHVVQPSWNWSRSCGRRPFRLYTSKVERSEMLNLSAVSYNNLTYALIGNASWVVPVPNLLNEVGYGM